MAKGNQTGGKRDNTSGRFISFGSLKPHTTTTVMPDIGEKLTIPYGSLKTATPAPVQSPPQPAPQQTLPPSSTEKK